MKPEPTKALLDADFLVYRVGFSTQEEEETDAHARLIEQFNTIVYFDLSCEGYKAYITGKKNFRYDIAVTHPYKGNRKDFVKPKHYDYLRNLLMRMGAEMTDGIEADDAVGIESFKDNYWIVHQDKDLDQLPGWHYNPVKQLKYYVTEFDGLYNFYKQLLVGDRVDNIVGLHGIGPVKATKILDGCKTEEELYLAVQKAYAKANEPYDRIIENARLLWLQREEGQIWEPPIEAKQCEEQGTTATAVGNEETA